MNILFLDQFSDLGGAQQCLLDLLPAIQQEGWNAHVAMPGEGALFARVKALGITADSVPGGPFSSGKKSLVDVMRFALEWRRVSACIGELLNRYSVDLLYVNGPRLLPAAAAHPLPAVFHCHSYVPHGPSQWLMRRALRKTRATVIASCHFVADPLRKSVARDRLRVIYNGVGELSPRHNTVQSPTAGIVGRIAPEKGHLEFVEAIRILAARKVDCRYLICGAPLFGDRKASAYYERVRSLAAGLPVEFVGWQSEIGGVLAGVDLLVVPSVVSEATPRVILEAYSAGVPVVAFRSGGIPEILEDGRTGFLIDECSPGALADRIELLLKAPETLQQAADEARTLWRQRFTLDRYRREVVALCRAIAPKPSRSIAQ